MAGDDDLMTCAEEILDGLPASLEMPAGTGKTELVAAIAAVAAGKNTRTLILTHTHAGVDAIRRRVRRFGVPYGAVHIDTITGWAFDLVRSYPLISGVVVPATPDWSKSPEYVDGATKVASAAAIIDMHAASFGCLVVDEYQDCTTEQHGLVLAIAAAVAKSCVLGDRLQGIFGFGGQTLVDWDNDVLPNFPAWSRDHKPWRWAGHNEGLGQWLLDMRPGLLRGDPIDLSHADIAGVTWMKADAREVIAQAYALLKCPSGESILILGQWPKEVDGLAQRLNGRYWVMEELEGKFMADFLQSLDGADPFQYAYLLASYAKKCFAGLAGIDAPLLKKLQCGNCVSALKRKGIEEVQGALDGLIRRPSLSKISETMATLENASCTHLFKNEAWRDTRRAMDNACACDDLSCLEALGRIRDKMRHTGRAPGVRVVSRTVLVKGLEYDHVIVANATLLGDYRNLYVALTRPRKTLTILSDDAVVSY